MYERAHLNIFTPNPSKLSISYDKEYYRRTTRMPFHRTCDRLIAEYNFANYKVKIMKL